MTTLYRNFGFLLKDLSRLYTRRFEERARTFGLTLAQCKVLVHLAKNEGVSQKRLCTIADVEPTTMVRIIDRMAADGWVVREPDPADRRAHRLRVTPQADPIQDRIWQLADQTRAEITGDLSTAERRTFIELLERVHASALGLSPVEPLADEPVATPSVKRKPVARRATSNP